MCRAKCGVVVGTSRPLPGYWITPVLRVLRTLCHPLQQSRFMSGGAKRSSLNQRFHEIEIDSFLDIWIDGWIYLSIQISFAISPKSLIWPGNKALLWAQEAKGMSSAASPPHFFISPCPYLVSTFELRARKRTIPFNKKSATAVGWKGHEDGYGFEAPLSTIDRMEEFFLTALIHQG